MIGYIKGMGWNGQKVWGSGNSVEGMGVYILLWFVLLNHAIVLHTQNIKKISKNGVGETQN